MDQHKPSAAPTGLRLGQHATELQVHLRDVRDRVKQQAGSHHSHKLKLAPGPSRISRTHALTCGPSICLGFITGYHLEDRAHGCYAHSLSLRLLGSGSQSSQKWGGDPLREQGAASTSRPSLQKGGPRL
jgi:hypothetical protein